MKEQGVDGAEYTTGFRQPSDGWHTVEVQEGIGMLVTKDGAEWQDKEGNKAYKFTLKITDDTEDKDVTMDRIANTKNGGKIIADLLACAGLWKKLLEAFPGDNVSVFDQKVMDGIKAKLPGTSFMMETEQNKEGKAYIKTIASFAKQKEIIKERLEKEKAKGDKKGKTSVTGAATPAAETLPVW